jgi:hypothetical protein
MTAVEAETTEVPKLSVTIYFVARLHVRDCDNGPDWEDWWPNDETYYLARADADAACEALQAPELEFYETRDKQRRSAFDAQQARARAEHEALLAAGLRTQPYQASTYSPGRFKGTRYEVQEAQLKVRGELALNGVVITGPSA